MKHENRVTEKDKLIQMGRYKFENSIIEEIKKQPVNGIKVKELLKIIHPLRKKPIDDNIINLFYEQPTQFFNDFKHLLENTSLFDNTGTSIFTHYFHVLYEKYKNKGDSQYYLYENNFDLFFKEEGQFISLQDFYLDTPLHKIARLRDKKFFLNICQRLKEINLLNEELISIKNINDESCYDYIVKEIEVKTKLIIEKDFDIYNNFINDYPSLFQSLNGITRINLTFFSLKIRINSEILKEKDFNDTYNFIHNSLNKNYDGIINFLSCYLQSSINFFNILFQICSLAEDYNKMINLLKDLLNKGNKKEEVESIIIDHIKYVIRKMNSTNRKGKNEINYGVQLINNVLSIIFKDKDLTFQKAIYYDKTILVSNKNFILRNGLLNDLVYNPNLIFDQKVELLKEFKKIYSAKFGDAIGTDFLSVFNFFKLYKNIENSKSNPNNLTKYKKYLVRILAEFNFIGKIYKSVHNLCNKYNDKQNIDNYISELDRFLDNKYIDIFFNYKTRYGLSDEQINKIYETVKLFAKIDIKKVARQDTIINKYKFYIKDFYYENFYKSFIITNEKLTLYYIKELLEKLNENNVENNSSQKIQKQRMFREFVELFLLFKYDFNELIKICKQSILNIFSKDKKSFNSLNYKDYCIKYYIPCLKNKMGIIKDKPFEFSFYKFSLELFINTKDINVLSFSHNYTFISELRTLLNKYLTQLFIKWEEQCDFSPLSNFIRENIFVFIVLLKQIKPKELNKKKSYSEDNEENKENEENEKKNIEEIKKQNNEILNFFLDVYLCSISPEDKSRVASLKRFIFGNSSMLSNIGYELLENEIKVVYKIYIYLMVSFIRFKYGIYNPIVFKLKIYDYRKILNSFIKCYFNNDNKDIVYHFFFADKKYEDDSNRILSKLDFNYLFRQEHLRAYYYEYKYKYLSIYLPSLVNKDNSLVFEYIKYLINEYQTNEYIDLYDKKLLYLIISRISNEQNNDIYNSIVDLVLPNDKKLNYFSFLEEDSNLYYEYEEKISHTIKVIQQISNEIFNKNKKDILLYIKNNFNAVENTVLNLYRFILVLRKERNNLYNIVKNNNFLIINAFYTLYKNYFVCLENEKYYYSLKLKERNEILQAMQTILSEIIIFIDLYNKEKNLRNVNELNIGDILLYLFSNKTIYHFNEIIGKEIKKSMNHLTFKYFDVNKSKNLKLKNNWESFDLPNLINHINKNPLILVWFIFYIKDEEYIKKNPAENELYFNNYNSDIITFIFDELLDLINPDLKIKYEPFKNFFINFVSQKHYYIDNENSEENEEDEENKNENKDDSKGKFNDMFSDKFYFAVILIYIKRKYPEYNPMLFNQIYWNYFDNNFQDGKKFFLQFIKCLRENKNNENMTIHLFLIKNSEMGDFYIRSQKSDHYIKEININKYISRYLPKMIFTENSLWYLFISTLLSYIEKYENKENDNNDLDEKNKVYFMTEIISYIGFHYSQDNNKIIYNKILERFIKFKINFYVFLKYENEEKYVSKIIKIFEEIANNTAEKSSSIQNLDNFNSYMLNNNKINNFVNLYIILKVLKEEKKSLFNIIKSNLIFIIYFSFLFKTIFQDYYFFSESSDFPLIVSMSQKKIILFVLNEINEFYFSFLDSNINNGIYTKFTKLYNPNKKCSLELIFNLNNYFYNRICNNKNDIIKEYEIYKKILITFFGFSEVRKTEDNESEEDGNAGGTGGRNKKSDSVLYSIFNYSNTLIILLEKDSKSFLDYTKFLINNFGYKYKDEKAIELDIYRLILLLIGINLEETIKIYRKILSFINTNKEDINDPHSRINNIKKEIIKYLFNKSKHNTATELHLLEESNILSNLKSSLYFLNDITDKEASLFFMNKIKEKKLVDSNTKFFKEFISIPINNEFVFDALLMSIKDNEKKVLYENNKYIFEYSLFRYSENNGYYYITKIIDFISKFISKDEIKNMIICDFNKKEENLGNNDGEDRILPKDVYLFDDKDKEKIKELISYRDKYLFFNCLLHRKILNYETIATLFEYCPYINLILYLFPTFKTDLKEIFNFKIKRYISYFSIQKNKEKIQQLSTNFYNLSLFLESMLSNVETINSFNTMETKLFNYYIQIINFQITPEKLQKYVGYDAEKNENIEGNKMNGFNTLELLIILAFYEIKGTPIISIKNYVPNLYSNIFNYYQQFNQLNISQLCLKQNSDNKFLEYFKNLLEDNKEEYMRRIKSHPWINNFSIIIEQDSSYALDIDVPIENYIIELVENDRIKPFYESNKIDEFYSYLEMSFNSLFENKNVYKEFVYSLLDFDKTSSIIIQQCQKKNVDKDVDKYGEIFYEYSNYLQIIKSIYNHINLNKYENQNLFEINILNEDLTEKGRNKLNSLKNSIKIQQIQFYIINAYESLNMGNNAFFISLKNWINNDINKKEIKSLENNSKMDFLTYFSYLNLICITILNWLEKFEQIDKIQDITTKIYEDKLRNSYIISISKINYIENKNRENAKKNFGDCLYELGQELAVRTDNEYNNYENEQNQNNNNQVLINFYFNAEKDEFVETSSDVNLLRFIENKIDNIYNFIIYYDNTVNYKDLLFKFIKENISQNNINELFSMVSDLYKFDKNNNNKILNIFGSYLQNNKNLICSYLRNTADNCYQPTYIDCISFIRYEINRLFFTYLFPCLSFDKTINEFSDYVNYLGLKYNEYIDYSIIINEIKNTQFHNSDNLNALFQVRAIYYIINGDSFIRIFLDELYARKYWKANEKYLNENNIIKKNKINQKFKIKIALGIKYSNRDFKELISHCSLDNNSENSEKKIEKIKSNNDKNLLKPTNNKNKKIKYVLKPQTQIFYSIVCLNNFKRQTNIPFGYSGHIPNGQFCFGYSIQENANRVFNNKIIIKDKNDFQCLKFREDKKHPEKKHFKQGKKKSKYINVFDLIFTVKNINNNNIILEKNDISEIIRAYSDEKTFMALLNYNFPIKTKEEVNLELEKIHFNNMNI